MASGGTSRPTSLTDLSTDAVPWIPEADNATSSNFHSNDVSVDAMPTISDSQIEEEIKKYKKYMPAVLKAPFIDVLILYDEEDREEADNFREHLENEIILSDGQRVQALLYDCPEFTSLSGSLLQHLELVFERSTFVFVYLTKSFVNDTWCKFSSESCLMKTISDEERRWCVRPVHTQSKDTRKFKIPMGLNTLIGINYYNNNKFYRDGVANLIDDKVNVKFKMEEELKVKQKEWIEKYKGEVEEEMLKVETNQYIKEGIIKSSENNQYSMHLSSSTNSLNRVKDLPKETQSLHQQQQAVMNMPPQNQSAYQEHGSPGPSQMFSSPQLVISGHEVSQTAQTGGIDDPLMNAYLNLSLVEQGQPGSLGNYGNQNVCSPGAGQPSQIPNIADQSMNSCHQQSVPYNSSWSETNMSSGGDGNFSTGYGSEGQSMDDLSIEADGNIPDSAQISDSQPSSLEMYSGYNGPSSLKSNGPADRMNLEKDTEETKTVQGSGDDQGKLAEPKRKREKHVHYSLRVPPKDDEAEEAAVEKLAKNAAKLSTNEEESPAPFTSTQPEEPPKDTPPPETESPVPIHLVLEIRNEKRELHNIEFDFTPGQDSADGVSRELVESGLVDDKDMTVVAANLQTFLDKKHWKCLRFALAIVLGVIAERNLPLSMVQVLIDLAKELAKDIKALQNLSMVCTSAS